MAYCYMTMQSNRLAVYLTPNVTSMFPKPRNETVW